MNHNLKLAWRSIVKRRGTAFIMLIGLVTGITCTALVGIYVLHETSYDTSFSLSEVTYRMTFKNDQGKHMAGSPSALAPFLENEFPGVSSVCRVFYPHMRSGSTSLMEVGDTRLYEHHIIYADSTFFTFFDAPFVEGNHEYALDNPSKIVLSKETAERYFEEGQAVGKTIRMNDEHEFQVSGVVDFPTNSHFEFDFILPPYFNPDLLNEWTRWPCWTYMKVERPQQIEYIEAGISDILEQNASPYDPLWADYEFILQPIALVHNSAGMSWDVVSKVDKRQLIMLLLIAIAILLLGSINFINLATAKATERAKETGIKKLMGAEKKSLVIQFLLESCFLSVLAGVCALVLTVLLLPLFSELSDSPLSLTFIQAQHVLLLFILSLLVGLIAGIYPAFVIARFDAGHILKSYGVSAGASPWIRKSLVVFQLLISVGLIIATLIIQDQMQFMQQMNLGYDQRGVVSVRLREANEQTFQRLKNELTKQADVEQVSAASHAIGAGSGTWSFYPPGMDFSDQNAIADYIRADYSFFDLMDIPFVEGRPFSRQYASDLTNGLIINEAAARQWQLDDPVNTMLQTDIDRGVMENKQIVGVVKDFHYKSPEFEITPLVIDIDTSTSYRNVYIRTSDFDRTLSKVEGLWSAYYPEYPVEYKFQEEIHQASLDQHQTLKETIATFSLIAILISSIGLLGLVGYLLNLKRKEIGIRKVLGSTVVQLFNLIFNEFLWLILIANLIAWPIIYLMMNDWLASFASRTSINLILFLLAGLGSISLVFLVVGYNILLAAKRNPVKMLRVD